MQFEDIAIPEIYNESEDFRFFLKWFATCLDRINYDTENFIDLYDPQRCPADLLWLLADTVGYKYDDRLPTAFNRMVLLYFMSMIRNRGSKDGVTLAAEVNLTQFQIMQVAGTGYTDDNGDEIAPNPELFNRLESTSIPVNSVYVMPHTESGYIDVVYFSTEQPIDACIEYVRPLGMYLFQHSGVRFDSRTKVSIDARLTNTNELLMSIGPTHVGHYSRKDYASLQREDEPRSESWYRNRKYENTPSINSGLRSLYSLQLCNNNQIVDSLLQYTNPIFSLGYNPQSDDYQVDDTRPGPATQIMKTIDGVSVKNPENYLRPGYSKQDEARRWNLRYDKILDEQLTHSADGVYDTYLADSFNSATDIKPNVNPIMSALGDAMSLNQENTKYLKVDSNGKIIITSK